MSTPINGGDWDWNKLASKLKIPFESGWLDDLSIIYVKS